jgi:hypothetical protein
MKEFLNLLTNTGKMKKLININVESYSGFNSDEYPKYFYLGKNKFEIFEITDRWYQGANITDRPVSNYFKVETSCGQQFILKHDLSSDEWNLCQ